MKNLRRAYLSIGSNIGDKKAHLQKAVDQLQKTIGNIKTGSSIYKTPAWGFKGADFLNACLAIDTALTPEKLLQNILQIEHQMGRTRGSDDGYVSRTIDIDIIFYEEEIIQGKNLTIPHPQLHLRRFVLEPLAEIAPGKIHPVIKKSVIELLEACLDDSVIEKRDEVLKWAQEKPFSKYNYIAIEGNIGAGKTTLATKIANDFNGKLVLERFADNPFLPKFYQDKQRYAFPLEMSFLADRYQQFTDDSSQFDLFKNFMVSDYDIYKSLIFAKITLPEDEFILYRKLFNHMYKDVIKPDIYVYLYQNTERLLYNIKQRGRDYEQNIAPEYLEQINQGYVEFIKTQQGMKVLVIDVSAHDFVRSSVDYKNIITKILDFKG
ncbi:2-amino-4-hydroxy-6-hydroxymethyldihydropteridine diphosphokinase [Leptobacterium sp. I13]|uniref:2-amino-4-hydroxy-6- hydroxymethyldihydropteridine diphosphokinase n=1 Tax=Leptobacterium meishanense TaxID=3128904 RepID=UPI0030ED726B